MPTKDADQPEMMLVVRRVLERPPREVPDGGDFEHGVTTRDILRVHELLRRCGWHHLFRSNESGAS